MLQVFKILNGGFLQITDKHKTVREVVLAISPDCADVPEDAELEELLEWLFSRDDASYQLRISKD